MFIDFDEPLTTLRLISRVGVAVVERYRGALVVDRKHGEEMTAPAL